MRTPAIPIRVKPHNNTEGNEDYSYSHPLQTAQQHEGNEDYSKCTSNVVNEINITCLKVQELTTTLAFIFILEWGISQYI